MNDTYVFELLKSSVDPEEMEKAGVFLEGKKCVFLSLPFEIANLEECVNLAVEINLWAAEHDAFAASPSLIALAFRDMDAGALSKLLAKCAVKLVESCAEFWVYGTQMTRLMLAEMLHARALGKKVRFLQRKNGKFIFVGGVEA